MEHFEELYPFQEQLLSLRHVLEPQVLQLLELVSEPQLPEQQVPPLASELELLPLVLLELLPVLQRRELA